jgi:acyl carrier protein phosphodiesterase
MNYLAHSFLSDNNPALIVGNFLADHLSGNRFEKYSSEIIEGVYLHRKIDVFTDAHPKFKESKRIFYKSFEKYSGILIDIYFDHLLAKNFDRYSPVSLEQYCKKVYAVYTNHISILPEDSARFLDYVLRNDIYRAYSRIDGIERVLFHLSHRIKHGVLLHDSVPVFEESKADIEFNFEIFFQDALKEFLPHGIYK